MYCTEFTVNLTVFDDASLFALKQAMGRNWHIEPAAGGCFFHQDQGKGYLHAGCL